MMNFHSKLLDKSFFRGESNLILLTEKKKFWRKDEEFFISIFSALFFFFMRRTNAFYLSLSTCPSVPLSISLTLSLSMPFSLSLSIYLCRYLYLFLFQALSPSSCKKTCLHTSHVSTMITLIFERKIWNDNWKHSLSMMTAITHEISVW